MDCGENNDRLERRRELTVAASSLVATSGRLQRVWRGKDHQGPITIVLADDQTLVRGGIRCLVEIEEDFKVVGEAADGGAVVSLVERLKPDMVIVAAAMPGLNGLEITRLVCQQSPAPAVIVLSKYSEEQYVIQALRNGAAGYVVTRAKRAELVRAIRRVVAGHDPLFLAPTAGPAHCRRRHLDAIYSDFRYSASSVFSGSVSLRLKNWS
jgi:DNA-binding NarL/FixJ family response regulator